MSSHDDLKQLRRQLDEIDRQIVEALAARDDVVRRIGELKLRGGELRDPDREQSLLTRLGELAREHGLDGYYVTRLFREILEHSIRAQTHKLVEAANPQHARPQITVGYQGIEGSYSEQAARRHFAHRDAELGLRGFDSFAEMLEAVRDGEIDYAMLPIENSLYGRVADIHHLLPESGLYIIGEHFVPIRLQLLALPGAKLEDIRYAHSHTVALGQCRRFLKERGIEPVTAADTAGSAKQVAELGDPTHAAIASKLAGELNNLEVLVEDIEDADHNTTRFLVMSRRKIEADRLAGDAITSFVFEVRNVPAALYKALGGFATNGVNMVKLESYMINGSFTATQFYAEVEGHPDDRNVELALEELGFFSKRMKVLGVYPASPYRKIAARKLS